MKLERMVEIETEIETNDIRIGDVPGNHAEGSAVYGRNICKI